MGFILAAIVAAALSPSLNSMASTTVRDFYLPFFKRDASESDQMRVGRIFTVIWGVLQMGVAVLAQNVSSALDRGLAVLGYASGPTVGAFLLGVLTRTADTRGTMTGMLVGLVVTIVLGRPIAWLGWPGMAWTWNVAVGGTVTVGVGWLASRLTARS
jgi:Na+/proline symporter